MALQPDRGVEGAGPRADPRPPRLHRQALDPWAAGTVHDFLHAKVCVCDDVVFAGSFNHSHSGEQNAENVLEIDDPELADRLAAWIDGVRARYAASGASPWARAPATSRSTASSGSSQSVTSSRSSGET